MEMREKEKNERKKKIPLVCIFVSVFLYNYSLFPFISFAVSFETNNTLSVLFLCRFLLRLENEVDHLGEDR